MELQITYRQQFPSGSGQGWLGLGCCWLLAVLTGGLLNIPAVQLGNRPEL